MRQRLVNNVKKWWEEVCVLKKRVRIISLKTVSLIITRISRLKSLIMLLKVTLMKLLKHCVLLIVKNDANWHYNNFLILLNFFINFFHAFGNCVGGSCIL